jgi:hypothetical protein
MIARAARLIVIVELFKKKLVEADEVSDFASRQFLAWCNSLRLILRDLGLRRPQQAPASLKAYVGGKAA